MFEGIKPFVNGQNALRARSAEQDAQSARARADAAENSASRGLEAAGILVMRARNAEARISEQDAEIARLKDALALETAVSAGFKAQSNAFKAQHPDTPLLADSGKRFKDGDVKTRGRLIYEAAFDKKAREMGIANPAERRVD